MYELKKLERYLQVNLLGPDPRFIKKEFTGPRSHKGWETLVYRTAGSLAEQKRTQEITFKFGSSAVKNTVTLYGGWAIMGVMIFICSFFLSRVHSFIHSCSI